MTTLDFYPFNNAERLLVEDNKVVLVTPLGHFCGYVAIPAKELPAGWGGNYNADCLQYLKVHGGITYASVEGEYFVFGFDCAHAGDDENDNLQDPKYVMLLTKQMEQQLRLLAERILNGEFRKYGRAQKAKILDEIRDQGSLDVNRGLGHMIGMLSGFPELKRGGKKQ